MTTIINHNRRKAAIFLLILFIVFGFLSYKQEAEAIAPVLAAAGAVGIAFCAYLLVTAGVTFATTGDAQAAAEAVYNQSKPVVDAAVMLGNVYWDSKKMMYKFVADGAGEVWDAVKTWADATFNEGENIIETDEPIELTGTFVDFGTANGTIHLVGSSGTRDYYFYRTSNGTVSYVHYQKVDLPSHNISYETTYTGTTSDSIHLNKGTNWSISFGTQSMQTSMGLSSYSLPSSTSTGVSGQTGVIDNPNWDWQYPQTGLKPIDIPLVGVQNPEGADFQYRTMAGDQVGLNVDQNVLEDVISKTAPDIIGAQTGTDGMVKIDDATIDLTDEGTADFPTDYNTTDETTKNLKFLLFTKFPFCLPWDMVNAVKLIAAAPEAPNFEIDLLAPLGATWIDKAKIVFDMEEYEIVGSVIRWASTVEFCWMLILATRKLIWG